VQLTAVLITAAFERVNAAAVADEAAFPFVLLLDFILVQPSAQNVPVGLVLLDSKTTNE